PTWHAALLACRAAHCSPHAALSSPRTAPAAGSPPARCLLAARSPPLGPFTALAACSPPLRPARCPYGLLAAPAARSPLTCGPRTAPAACSPLFCGPRAARAACSPPSCGPRSTPCSPLATPCGRAPPLAARSPPFAARYPPLAARLLPLAALSPPLAARSPPLPAHSPPLVAQSPPLVAHLPPLAARLPPFGSPLAALSAGRPSHAPPCPALRTSLVLARRPTCVLLCWLCATLFCPLWLLSVYSCDSANRSQWLTRDAAARLAVRNHLPLAERAHFGQHKTAKALYDAVVACYSSPATVALGGLLLPYLLPELSTFATVEDLVTHLPTSDARYRAALPAEFLDRNPPPMYITLFFLVICLPDSLRTIRDHFLAFDPTALTVDLLEQHLLAAESSVVAIGAARGTPHRPFFEGCFPSPLAPSYASAAAVDILGAADVGAASPVSGKRRSFQNGIAECRIGLVMEVAHTSMIHAAAPHFLWPFAVRYAPHQLNLWPRVSLPETSPTLRWTGKVGDASVFRVWGSRAFVHDKSADKLSSRAIPCVFLGLPPDMPGWHLYHPTSRRVLPSQDDTFDESDLFYCLFPYCTAPLPPPPLFLAPGPPLVDPLPPQGRAPSRVSQVDPLLGTVPVEVAVES
ncbi:unnamed protein product, partial [Closterium sp. NIES-54]